MAVLSSVNGSFFSFGSIGSAVSSNASPTAFTQSSGSIISPSGMSLNVCSNALLNSSIVSDVSFLYLGL